MSRKPVVPHSVMPFVLSYSRSGMHWLRHCVERMSGKRTPGMDLGLTDDKGYAYCRLHNIARGVHKVSPRGVTFDRVCLLLRDYREIYVRTPRLTWTSVRSMRFRAYAKNILFFEQFTGPKMIIDFAKHVRGFEESMRFMDWAGMEYRPLDPSQYDASREISKRWYQENKKQYYRRTPNREITNDAKLASKRLLVAEMGQELFNKYLADFDDSDVAVQSAA